MKKGEGRSLGNIEVGVAQPAELVARVRLWLVGVFARLASLLPISTTSLFVLARLVAASLWAILYTWTKPNCGPPSDCLRPSATQQAQGPAAHHVLSTKVRDQTADHPILPTNQSYLFPVGYLSSSSRPTHHHFSLSRSSL